MCRGTKNRKLLEKTKWKAYQISSKQLTDAYIHTQITEYTLKEFMELMREEKCQ